MPLLNEKTFLFFFDDFDFRARFLVALCAAWPILTVGAIKSIESKSPVTGTFSFSLFVIFCAFVAKVAREKGIKVQDKIRNDLNALPTTVIMRFTDNRISTESKHKYHKILNKHVENAQLPLSKEEETAESDAQYDAVINWLRNWANANKEKAPLVYKELIEYNFWRNLYGIKKDAMSIYFLIIIRELFLLEPFSFKTFFLQTASAYYPIGVLSISTLVFAVTVNEDTVKARAFDYAKTLVESCERID